MAKPIVFGKERTYIEERHVDELRALDPKIGMIAKFHQRLIRGDSHSPVEERVVSGVAPPNNSPTEAAKHVGETATVTGAVDGFHQSGKGNIFPNMGGKYPNQSFTAFIPSGSAAQFPNAQQYEGRTITVSGKIALYKGKPEIIVTSPAQIVAK